MNDFPICEGCGERHAPHTPDEILAAATNLVLQAALPIAEEHGEHFSDLAEAVALWGDAARAVLIARLSGAPAAAPAPTAAPDSPGFYL